MNKPNENSSNDEFTLKILQHKICSIPGSPKTSFEIAQFVHSETGNYGITVSSVGALYG